MSNSPNSLQTGDRVGDNPLDRSCSPNWELEVFYDGDCPLCRREIAFLQRHDRRGAIRFTNIAAPDFSAQAYGRTWDELMSQIQARLRDGTWLRGIEVFRRLYAAIGYRRLVAFSRWPVVSQLAGWGYAMFAKQRLRLTGRCSVKHGCPETKRPS